MSIQAKGLNVKGGPAVRNKLEELVDGKVSSITLAKGKGQSESTIAHRLFTRNGFHHIEDVAVTVKRSDGTKCRGRRVVWAAREGDRRVPKGLENVQFKAIHFGSIEQMTLAS